MFECIEKIKNVKSQQKKLLDSVDGKSSFFTNEEQAQFDLLQAEFEILNGLLMFECDLQINQNYLNILKG
ncbi:MAG: hypothetical protein GX640_01930 [Fibrobacter sp.]|nr:hypothetical protein [Fibrobacter sp.]